MNRCHGFSFPAPSLARRLRFLLAMAVLSLGMGAPSAWAQINAVRTFPADALRATVVIVQAPAIQLNNNPDRMSPGVRIWAQDRHLVFPNNLVGQELTVNYTRDTSKLVNQMWILTPAEAALKRPNNQPNYRFESDIPPPSDDGKTPFNQLPKFPGNQL